MSAWRCRYEFRRNIISDGFYRDEHERTMRRMQIPLRISSEIVSIWRADQALINRRRRLLCGFEVGCVKPVFVAFKHFIHGGRRQQCFRRLVRDRNRSTDIVLRGVRNLERRVD